MTEIARQPVTGSSNIVSIGHADGVMDIEFTGGQVYRYTGPKVTDHYNALMKAQSKGGYVAKSLRHCAATKCAKIPKST